MIQFAHPHLLWLLLVVPPAFLAFLWWAARKRQKLLMQFIQSRLLPGLTVGISSEREQLRIVLLLGAIVALILALAGPRWGFTLEEAHQKGLDVVIAIDTSKSMLAEDIAPNRLARAKLAALDLMQTAKSDRLGLIAFAGTAFLQCPLTIDDAAFRQSVDILDVNTLPQGGTAIAEAIATAQAAFKKEDGYKVLVLFTDGEDHDSNALEAAKKAAEEGMRIFTIGVGSAEGELLRVRDSKGRMDYVRDEQGNVVKSRLNEKMLQEIAGAGHGFYLPLRGAKVMETLYKNGLESLPKTESEVKTYKRYHERFYWPLSIAIILLVIEVLLPARKNVKQRERSAGSAGTKSAAAAIAILLLPLLAQGSASSAMRSYEAGQYDKARAEYERLLQKQKDDPRLALNAGTAAYREGNLQKADGLLSQATTAPDLRVQQQAYYNRGNVRFHAGEAQPDAQAKQQAWEKSLEDFHNAMKLNDADADAKYNYEYVKQKLEELKQQQQQQQNQDQQDDQRQDQKDQQNQQQQDSQSQDQQNQEKQNQQNQQQQEQQQKDQQSKPDEQDRSQQTDQKQQEQKDQQSQQNAGKPEEQKDQNAQGQPAGAADQQQQMTPEQALRVLDSTKGDEKVLPLQPLQPPPNTDQRFKDW